jgi:hypothetical protein
MTTVNHPRHGVVEVIDESLGMYRINHPVHDYPFWILKSELDAKPAAAKRQKAKLTRKSFTEFIECEHGIFGSGTCDECRPSRISSR